MPLKGEKWPVGAIFQSTAPGSFRSSEEQKSSECHFPSISVIKVACASATKHCLTPVHYGAWECLEMNESEGVSGKSRHHSCARRQRLHVHKHTEPTNTTAYIHPHTRAETPSTSKCVQYRARDAELTGWNLIRERRSHISLRAVESGKPQ